MAVVLTSEDDSYFSSSLRRSHSQPKFHTQRPGFRTSSSTSRLNEYYSEPSSASSISSAPSSPRAANAESAYLSDSSTPATNFSLASDCDETSTTLDDDPVFQQCGGSGYFGRLESYDPLPSPQGESEELDDMDAQLGHQLESDSTATSRPGSPDNMGRAEDDIAVRALPSMHVDYLSHNWREEDIWSSWKLIVSRRGDYNNSARLENASWRTWMKSKNKLDTVSAETLNWLKDNDVTWLYGPLQTGTSSLHHTSTNSTSARLSKSNSFINNKKPILKKRSMSEIMLQQSLSTSSLVKQAAAAVQAQQKGNLKRIGRRPGLERAATDYITFPFSSRRLSHNNSSLCPSTSSSGVVSPNSGRKHIHFNEQVSQCIAVDIKGDDDDDEVDRYHYNSDSDDGVIMMKRTRSKKRRPILRKTKSHNHGGESKTIAMLPSTTLKFREDTPDPAETALKHSKSPILSPSSSQETLRPSKKSSKIFFAGDEDEDDDDEDEEERISIRPGTFPGSQFSEGGSGLRRSTSTASLSAEPAGMRRTASGMFMPAEGIAPSSLDDGMVGRILNTVNTARDIVHVIWNVGWRR
ncbi:uncharacterized protein C8A04DRAFT_37614 [Dichotomopilus funicola]|uniref:Nitrogen regulatory protein areA GATA-like domain-containing protein n=1 Tax=Dichotomopilus funicola TaxID=1934379 RepID=A0AAN6V1R0_9PEZI|nr:hypothetical protein C8A04DRAFT_37614 [Dichotomopilus funicola]